MNVHSGMRQTVWQSLIRLAGIVHAAIRVQETEHMIATIQSSLLQAYVCEDVPNDKYVCNYTHLRSRGHAWTRYVCVHVTTSRG